MDLPFIHNKIEVDEECFHWDGAEARSGTPNGREVQRWMDISGVIVNILQRNVSKKKVNISTKRGGLVVLHASRLYPRLVFTHIAGGRGIIAPTDTDSDGLIRQLERLCSRDCVEKISAVCQPALQCEWRESYDDAR